LATVNELLAGSVGGAAQILVGQPLDTVKTRAQIAPSSSMYIEQAHGQRHADQGFFALYKAPGMASPLIGIAGVNSLPFACYGIWRCIISPFPQLTLAETALAGSMAGAANAILAIPGTSFRLLKQGYRMQGQYSGETDKRLRVIAREMWTQWGRSKGVMCGYWVTFAREIPAYAGFIYTTYEFSKRKFSAKSSPIAYWLACYPLDVIKSRIQLREAPPMGSPFQCIGREFKLIVIESG
ncbi:mitochondrial carrier, partial [Mycena vulgaris]